MPYLAAVHFQFRFTGTSRTDAAAKTGKILPVAGQSRQPVFELSQLYLQFALPGSGAAGKNIQDEACSIDDLGLQRLFQILGLTGREFFVEDDNIHTFNEN